MIRSRGLLLFFLHILLSEGAARFCLPGSSSELQITSHWDKQSPWPQTTPVPPRLQGSKSRSSLRHGTNRPHLSLFDTEDRRRDENQTPTLANADTHTRGGTSQEMKDRDEIQGGKKKWRSTARQADELLWKQSVIVCWEIWSERSRQTLTWLSNKVIGPIRYRRYFIDCNSPFTLSWPRVPLSILSVTDWDKFWRRLSFAYLLRS